MLSILKYIPTSAGSLHFSTTSHSISFSLYIPASPSQSLSVSLTWSLSCYILPLLWGWQSHIRHVIRREMWERQGETGGGENDVTGRPRLCTGLQWHLQAARSAPEIHLLYCGLSVASQHMSPSIPQYQPHSSSLGGVTKDNLVICWSSS